MSTPRTYQFDVDTKRYLNRVNTYRSLNGLANIQKSDAADIDNFVIGLKDLGVWNYIIDFWLLIPEHSLGTSSLVLGGLGRLNGSLSNSPTWGTNGIRFLQSNQSIYLSRGLDFLGSRGIREFTNFAVLKTDINNGDSHICGIEAYLPTNPATGSIHSVYGPTGNRVHRQSSLTGGSTNRSWGSANTTNVGVGFYFAASGRNNINDPVISEGFTEHNSIRNTNKGGTGTLPRTFIYDLFFIFGSQSSSRDETAAFQIWFNKMLDASQTAGVRSVIKQTIGKGLNLP